MTTIKKLPLLCIFIILLISGCATKSFGTKKVLPEYGMGDIFIEVPKYIVVHSVDGKATKLPQDRKYHLKVSPGQHVLTVSYLKDWKDPSVNELSTGGRRIKKIVQWNKIDLSFSVLEGVDYRIRYKIPKSYKEAKAEVASTPIWIEERVTRSNDEQVDNKSKELPIIKKDQSELTDNIQVSVIPVDKTQQETFSRMETENQSLQAKEQIKALNMLKHWWSEATEQEKKEFLLWTSP